MDEDDDVKWFASPPLKIGEMLRKSFRTFWQTRSFRERKIPKINATSSSFKRSSLPIEINNKISSGKSIFYSLTGVL